MRAPTRVVRLNVNEVNVGIHENMWRTLMASRGTFFRWISADDWLEPGCLSTCVHALESRPDAIGVTTWFTIHTPDGTIRREEFCGEFPTSPDPAQRFARMLWFFHAGDAKYDPIYGVYRRDRLTRFWRPCVGAARLAAQRRTGACGTDRPCEQRLANRTRDYLSLTSIEPRSGAVSIPVRAEQLRTSPQRLYRELLRYSSRGEPDRGAVPSLHVGSPAVLGQGDRPGSAFTLAGCRHRLFSRRATNGLPRLHVTFRLSTF